MQPESPDVTLAKAIGRLRGAGGRPGDHFREMVEHADHGMALIAPDGRVLEANAQACIAMGAARADIVGAVLWEAPGWRAPELRQKLRVSVSAALRGSTVRHEIDTGTDEEASSLDTSLTPIIGTDGTAELIVLDVRDVTARKTAELALRESEERFHRIISIAVDGIISIDDAQCITLFNQGAEQIFGYTAGEVIGRPLNMLLPRELGAIHTKEVRAFGESPEVARRMGTRRQIFGRRKNGEIFNADASISKATVNGRRVYTAVLQDVTARWLAEQEKNELLAATQHARDVAERAARQRDEMVEIVSHDLRNPLSAIGMCAATLANDDLPSDERIRLAETIHESVEWTHRLIADLLDIASIEAGRLSVKKELSDPVITIAKALSLFELPASDHAVSLKAAGVEHLPSIDADSERLLQVLANLIGNALKFTPAGGTITVGGDVRDNAVVFSVQDTGPGIAPEHIDQVFERRWHAGQIGKHGMGLGLAIARGIVEAHGGRIWVTSTPGAGSLFEFSIPLGHPAPSL
jgi:PAS domain S-box-containing protein